MNTVFAVFRDDAFRSFVVSFGVLVAMVSIATARSIARKKQAADLLFASRSIKELQLAVQCIDKHHNATDSNLRALADKDKTNGDEAKLVRCLLNHFELISVGIQNGIYDERMIKESWCSIVTRTYDKALPFIQAVRERDSIPTLYQEFELLAKRWKDHPLAHKRSWSRALVRRFFLG